MIKTVYDLMTKIRSEGLNVLLIGSETQEVDHLSDLSNADNRSLIFYVGKDREEIDHINNCVLICCPDIAFERESVSFIVTENPKLAFYILAQDFAHPKPEPSIHPTAIINNKAIIHPTASIGPYCVLEECEIGEKTILHSHVAVYANSKIGSNVTIEANSVIGATGQGYVWGKDGKQWVMPQEGGTVIEDNCFIGSNVSIVRGTLSNTIIGEGSRIAHGTMIGHNCRIGKKTLMSNNVTVSGTVVLDDYCYLGSGSVCNTKIRLGKNVIVGAGAVVTKNFLEENIVLAGIPAKIIKRVDAGDSLVGVPNTPLIQIQ